MFEETISLITSSTTLSHLDTQSLTQKIKFGKTYRVSWLKNSVLLDKTNPTQVSSFPDCDGVGSTLKRLAGCVSLQRPFSGEILTPKQLFEFSNSGIIVVTPFFVNSQFVKKNIAFLESRFSNRSTFKGTCKNNELIPCGENIVMNRVSECPSEKRNCFVY